MKGRCGHNESELQVFWVDRAYALKLLFVKVTLSPPRKRGRRLRGGCGQGLPLSFFTLKLRRRLTRASHACQESHNTSKGLEATWRLSKVQFVYDSSEKTHFKDAVSGELRPAGLGRESGKAPTLQRAQA